MSGYKYQYVCPRCGTYLELKMRVTLKQRHCPQCREPITPQEIDRQLQKRREAASKLMGDLGQAIGKAGVIFGIVLAVAVGGLLVMVVFFCLCLGLASNQLPQTSPTHQR